jgi:hypothetical protein
MDQLNRSKLKIVSGTEDGAFTRLLTTPTLSAEAEERRKRQSGAENDWWRLDMYPEVGKSMAGVPLHCKSKETFSLKRIY